MVLSRAPKAAITRIYTSHARSSMLVRLPLSRKVGASRATCIGVQNRLAPHLPRQYSSRRKVTTAIKSQGPQQATKKQLEKANVIIEVRRAFHNALGSEVLETYKPALSDQLWRRRGEVRRQLPTTPFKESYHIVRRLIDEGLFWEPGADIELRALMFANSMSVLKRLSEHTFQISAEIMEQAEKEVPSKMENLKKASIMETSEAEAVSKKSESWTEQINDQQIGTEDSETGSEEVLTADKDAGTDNLAEEKELEDMVTFPEAIRSTPGSEDATAVIPAAFDESTRNSRLISAEELETRKMVEKIPVHEDEAIVKKMEDLRAKSRVLQQEGRRPDLKPHLYPNKARYILLSEATSLLEQACFNFVARLWPEVVKLPHYDCPEAQEFKAWTNLIKRELQGKKWRSYRPDNFAAGCENGDLIRNAAAHRTIINASKIRVLLSEATKWVDSLGDELTAQKLLRLEGVAVQMDDDVGEGVQPIVANIMGAISRIEERRDVISSHNQKIKELEVLIKKERESVKKEEDKIEVEEQLIKNSLKDEHVVRYQQGEALDPESLRHFIHRGFIKSEAEEKRDIDTTIAYDDIIEKIGSEQETEIDKKAGSSPKASIELSQKVLEQMLQSESAKLTEEDKKNLRFEEGVGLISSSDKTLEDIEEIREPRIKSRLGKYKPVKGSEDEIKDTQGEKSEVQPKGITFEGTNATRSSKVEEKKAPEKQWYNPFSWFN